MRRGRRCGFCCASIRRMAAKLRLYVVPGRCAGRRRRRPLLGVGVTELASAALPQVRVVIARGAAVVTDVVLFVAGFRLFRGEKPQL